MKHFITSNGNSYYIDGVFAFVAFGADRLTYWEGVEELESWIDAQY